jgi:hypothetical protein
MPPVLSLLSIVIISKVIISISEVSNKKVPKNFVHEIIISKNFALHFKGNRVAVQTKKGKNMEAVFLIMCDPSMNEL